MMVEGFMGAFVFGFLGTALPRLTGTSRFSRVELGIFIVLLLGAVGLHIGQQYVLGDAVFLGLLLLFALRMGWRFSQRSDAPPPSFALVAFGFANAIAGTVLLLAGVAGVGDMRWPALGLLLLYEGFVLYLVLGVGGFLLPRFLGVLARVDASEARETSKQWKAHAVFAAAIGVVLLTSFFVEVFAVMPKLAGVMRFLAAAAFLGVEILFGRSTVPSVTVTRCLRVALLLLLLGVLFPVIWPMQRVAGLHIVFIGGFTLITFTVATRVVLGHSGKGHLVMQPLPFLRVAAGLLVIAAILRAVGDFQWALRGRLLEGASYCWMFAAAVWSWRVLPNVRVPDSPEENDP
jgi:uncharacterized protein involved in response to NO